MTDHQLATLIRDNVKLIVFSNDVFIRRGNPVGWRITQSGERDAWAKTLDDAMEIIAGKGEK